ncbi:hypothetical protein [Pelagicoccus mobilis]|uniref:Uncharacterized protein n=1 Tax=Pelagicoccus mobilis TaxID=415221 RepID=A0A934VPU7_9BACT|nr:hypothetical protein [Pelagicoccus mobilis]MBK1875903.1 hypothetical protein [Pelagicoccus mobilis]
MSYLLEFIAVCCVFGILIQNASFKKWLKELSPRSQLILVGFVLIMTAGHFVRSSKATFPFVHWDMYTKPLQHLEMYHFELEATLSDGQLIELNPSRLFPSLGFGSLRIHNKIHNLCVRLETDAKSYESDAKELLEAIAYQYERKHPQASLDAVSLKWITESLSDNSSHSEVLFNLNRSQG